MKKNTPPSDFKGFDDFIELFVAGTRTDSSGRTQNWTNQDIDQIISNHSAGTAAPIVIGHPAADASSFAYGWVDQLKRDGNKLLGKFAQVDPGFSQLVESGKLKNRSVRILKDSGGLRLGHVGWLGATPPAITGLKPVEFASGCETFDFSAEWQSAGIMARMMRNMRKFLIAQFGQDKADAVFSNYDIDELNRLAEQQYRDELSEAETDANPLPSSFSLQDDVMSITQAELDAAKQEKLAADQLAADFSSKNANLVQQLADERAARKRIAHQALVDKHKARGVAPALLEGMVDFMARVDSEGDQVFEFSLGDGTAKKAVLPVDYLAGLLDALPVAVKSGRVVQGDALGSSDFSAPDGAAVDSAQLATHHAAQAYMVEHKCSYAAAIAAVSQ